MTRRIPAWLLILLVPAGRPSALDAREADPVHVEVRVDRSRATVGDPILVKVSVTHPLDFTLTQPSPVPGEGAGLILEAIGRETPAPQGPGAPGGPKREVYLFRGQAFETGKVYVPAFRVEWSRAGGAAGSSTSEPVPLEIVSVLKGGEDQPSDLKPPAMLPRPPFPWRNVLGAAIVALLAGLAAFWWYRRKRALPEDQRAASGPGLSPHELAYKELERLLASGLLKEGRLKEFHVELSEIAKRYLAGRFGIDTLERTTGEVLGDLRRARIGSSPLETAQDLLSETDLVKFAKYRPPEEEIRETVERAYRLVDLTKPVPPPPAPTAGDTPPGLSPERAG